MHESLDEFEIWRDSTTDTGLAYEKVPKTFSGENDVITFSQLFLNPLDPFHISR